MRQNSVDMMSFSEVQSFAMKAIITELQLIAEETSSSVTYP